MVKKKFFLITAFSMIKIAFSYPISMDIGTYAIDDYSSNGGGGNLNNMVSAAQNFFVTAHSIIPIYTQNTATPTHPMILRNTAVTNAAVTASTPTSIGQREYNDFIFYAGHGLSNIPATNYLPALFLGFNPAYHLVYPSSLNLGVGYNRFFMTHACALFNCPQGAQTCWSPAFKGLKAMLGYRSLIWDIQLNWDQFNEFWTNWTIREKSLLSSHFDAVSSVFSQVRGDPITGYEPGCLSAPVPEFTLDHCRLSFKYVAHDYAKANNGTGYYYSRIIGTPKY